MDLAIPATVTDIEDYAFAGNPELEFVVFTNPAPTIGTDAFSNGHAVETADVCFEFYATDTNQINDYYDNENNDSNDPACPRDVVIPQGVTVLRLGSFLDNSLTSVIIPDSVTTIGGSAFQDNSLTSVIIPDSVTTIVSNAFANNSLTSAIIGSGVTGLGNTIFHGNDDLSSICIERVAAGLSLATNTFTFFVTVDYQSDGNCFN